MKTLGKKALIEIDKELCKENNKILILRQETLFKWTYRALILNKETLEYEIIGIVRDDTIRNLTTQSINHLKSFLENYKLSTWNYRYCIITDY